MKQLFLFFLLLFSLSSTSQINTNGSIELGAINDIWSIKNYGTYVHTDSKYVMYSEINLKFNYKLFNVETSIFNTFETNEGLLDTYAPLEIIYSLKGYITFKKFSLGVGHMCQHPIMDQIYSSYDFLRRRSYTNIFIKYEFNFKRN